MCVSNKCSSFLETGLPFGRLLWNWILMMAFEYTLKDWSCILASLRCVGHQGRAYFMHVCGRSSRCYVVTPLTFIHVYTWNVREGFHALPNNPPGKGVLWWQSTPMNASHVRLRDLATAKSLVRLSLLKQASCLTVRGPAPNNPSYINSLNEVK
jgi:hypothetical protein